MSIKHIHAAAVIVMEAGKVLAVSRKDDHSNMGLPSGKLGHRESHSAAAIRETYEETGYHVILDLNTPPYHDVYDGYSVVTFKAYRVNDVPDAVSPEETGRVAFVPLQEILDGSFGGYNAGVIQWFNINTKETA